MVAVEDREMVHPFVRKTALELHYMGRDFREGKSIHLNKVNFFINCLMIDFRIYIT